MHKFSLNKLNHYVIDRIEYEEDTNCYWGYVGDKIVDIYALNEEIMDESEEEEYLLKEGYALCSAPNFESEEFLVDKKSLLALKQQSDSSEPKSDSSEPIIF